ncbi:hypothetical protein [Cytobacillus praedii]|uniref:hypothetical protein n=1 Tax=Cytobacillus praedii TaxID=1742358 RepID=UPI0013F4B3C9|nr:hypothetical protein [Cytobacillus praedii]
MIVVECDFYRSLGEMRHIIDRFKSKFKHFKLLEKTENMLIYQYDDGRKDM